MIIRRNNVISLVIGFILGLAFNLEFLTSNRHSCVGHVHDDFEHIREHIAHDDPTLQHEGHDAHDGHVHDGENDGPQSANNFDDGHSHIGEDDIAKSLYNQVRVACLIMTKQKNYNGFANNVRATWGKRCNSRFYFSSNLAKNANYSDILSLNVTQDLDVSWGKTKMAFDYAYSSLLNEYDYFLKADDETFVVLENLRYMLSKLNASDPIYLGRRFKPKTKQGYMSGGAGYVLSRESVKRFVEVGLRQNVCKEDHTLADDAVMGICLEKIGVRVVDSLDEEGRNRFHPFTPEYHLVPGTSPPNLWIWSYDYHPYVEGPNCCSDTSVTFHYVNGNQMYGMEYLIYHLKPFGIVPHFNKIRRPLSRMLQRT